MTYSVANPGPGLRQVQICGRVWLICIVKLYNNEILKNFANFFFYVNPNNRYSIPGQYIGYIEEMESQQSI
jgi:hypothetical protein